MTRLVVFPENRNSRKLKRINYGDYEMCVLFDTLTVDYPLKDALSEVEI